MPKKYTPRLSVEISEEDSFALRRHLPTGFQKVVFNIIIKDLIKLFERFGANQVVAALCSKDISLEKMCRLNMESTNDNHSRAESVNKSDE